MKKIAIILYLVAIACIAAAQPFTNKEVGIDEHLGDTIPLNLTFVNEKGDTVTLKQLVNKPTVIAPVYFDCPGICSRLLEGVANVIEETNIVLGKDYDVITFSFNDIDTPEKARMKKVNFITNLSDEEAQSWHFLTGDSTVIVPLLNSIGYKIRIAGLDFIHPSAIVIVSPEGKITRYLYGLKFLPFDLKMAVVEAQQGIARPTANRILEFCFSYEPEGRRYTLEVTKLAGIFTLLVLAVFLLTLLFRRRKASKKTENEQ